MNITGKSMIFKSQYGYSTTISNKNQNGEYEKMYISVQLPKDIELENKTMIEIKKGFLSFYKSKEGLPKLKLVIQEFTTDEQNYIKEERETIQNEQNYEFNPDEDLPF